MDKQVYLRRLAKCGEHMGHLGMDVLLLTKPSNMFYLTGDGRLCAYAMITKDGKVALGVPVTDTEDVKQLAHFDHIVGFDDEVGMIHSIVHYFEHFGISKGTVGLEYTFLTQSMMAMMTHPHAKPEGVLPKDCTHILSEMRMVKEPEEIERIRAAAKVAASGILTVRLSFQEVRKVSQKVKQNACQTFPKIKLSNRRYAYATPL